MVNKILPLLFLVACTETPVTLEPQIDIDIYSELPYQNGYHYLTVSEGVKQTLERLVATVTIDGATPEQPRKVYWNSNLRWTIENDERVVVYGFDSGYKTVPTVNYASYTDRLGQVHTVVGPIYEMKGDTMTVVVTVASESQLEELFTGNYYEYASDTIRIILQ